MAVISFCHLEKPNNGNLLANRWIIAFSTMHLNNMQGKQFWNGWSRNSFVKSSGTRAETPKSRSYKAAGMEKWGLLDTSKHPSEGSISNIGCIKPSEHLPRRYSEDANGKYCKACMGWKKWNDPTPPQRYVSAMWQSASDKTIRSAGWSMSNPTGVEAKHVENGRLADYASSDGFFQTLSFGNDSLYAVVNPGNANVYHAGNPEGFTTKSKQPEKQHHIDHQPWCNMHHLSCQLTAQRISQTQPRRSSGIQIKKQKKCGSAWRRFQ